MTTTTTPNINEKELPLFDPLATTPATNLTAPLPPGLDADILVIGGKDVRSLLYTAWSEAGPGPYGGHREQRGVGGGDGTGHGQERNVGAKDGEGQQNDTEEEKLSEWRTLRERKIDITISHEDKYVVARNVLVLSLILGLDRLGDEEVEDGGDFTKDGTTKEDHSEKSPAKGMAAKESAEKTFEGRTTEQIDQKEKLRRIWNTYYSRFLHDAETRKLLAQQSAKLCQLSQTLFSWSQGPYGSTLHFFDQKSLDAVRGVWEQYASAAAVSPNPAQEEAKIEKLAEAMIQGMKSSSSSDEQRKNWASSGSSTAPITILLRNKIRNYVKCDWELDQYYAEEKEEEEDFANPMFACGMLPDSVSTSESEPGSADQGSGRRRLAYPSNGVLGYHLALNTKVPLSELSPLRMDTTDTTTKDDSNKNSNDDDSRSFDGDGDGDGDSDERDADGNVTALGVARHQFIQWSLAFLSLATAYPGRLKICFAVDGWFTLCQPLVEEKRQFDVIDSTDLSVSPFSDNVNAFWSPFLAGISDPPGILGLMVAAKRLLKDRASSTLVMDDGEGESSLVIDAPNDGNADDEDEHGKSEAETSSVSKPSSSKTTTINATSAFLLGLAAVECWTNASVRSTVDECLDAAASRFYDDDYEKTQGLVKVKDKDKEAVAVRLKRLEEEGRLRIRNRLFGKHSRWLAPGQQQHKPVRKRVSADAMELAEAAWRAFQDLVILKVKGQPVVHQGQELIKVSWGEGLWQTLLGYLGVVIRQFDTDREEFRRVILEKIGGNSTQDDLLREALLEGVSPEGNEAEADDGGPLFTANFDVNTSGTLKTITGHLDFTTEEDKRFLADKTVPIKLRQSSPWTIDIIFGSDKLVKPLIFPTPVLKEGSKTRIARRSGYIEVIAPAILDIRSATAASVLDEYIFPTVLQAADNDDSSSETGQTQLIPAPLNCPTVNLDSLPILSISNTSKLESFLPSLIASAFSPREIGLRKGDSDHWPARMQVKESIHFIINVATGLQVGQSGLFALTPNSGGRHVLIFVSAIRLDCSAQSGGSVLIDAAVLPLTHSLLAEAKRASTSSSDADPDDDNDLHTFLALLRTLECIDLTITDAELCLWKSILPSWAERCRTYPHLPSCEYSTTGHIPLSLKKGDPVLCTCGSGHFPPNYLPLPLWDTVASRYSTRVAISLPYCSPVAENSIFDPKQAREIAERGLVVKKKERKCRACGKTEEQLVKEMKDKGGETAGTKGVEVLKRCKRCLKVRYCGAECQRRDWKTHRTECVESEEYYR